MNNIKLPRTFLVFMGTILLFVIIGVRSPATIASLTPPNPNLSAPEPFLMAATPSPELKVIDSSAGKQYQLHIMDASFEVEVHCQQGTQPEMHNHDGLHALHCNK
ncbi:MAG: hypothetical protein ACRC8A_17670 [Microcoleaceae cyanobacterium]